MPFWLGEGLGRSDELSTAVSKLRTRADAVFGDDIEAGIEWLKSEYALDGVGAAQLANYYGSAKTALGLLPTRDKIVRSEEHTSELQSLMRISYAVFCLKKKKNKNTKHIQQLTVTTEKL